jgi:hypothetical protein
VDKKEKKEVFIFLPHYIRQKRHVTGALDGLCQCALVTRRKAGAAARHYLAVRIEKLF